MDDAMTPTISDYKSHIESALAYSGDGSHTFTDIEAGVADGSLQFWPGPNSVIVTQLVTQPNAMFCHVFVAGGNLAELEAMTPRVVAWAKEQGCTRASLIGRPGWERTYLARTGWQKRNLIIMETEL